MRKKRLIACLLIATCCFTNSIESMATSMDGYASNEQVQGIQRTDNKVTAEITNGVSAYFETWSELSSIESLTLITSHGYELKEGDVDFLINQFPQITELNVAECIFDSQNSLSMCDEYFAMHPEIIYSSGKTIAPKEQVAGINEENSDIYSQDKIIDENSVNYDVRVNGICLLDKIRYCEVGADYISNDSEVEFRWLQYDVSNKNWSIVSSWSRGNWAVWSPKKAGDYWIYVEARTSDGNITSSVYGYHYDGIQVALNGICLLNRGTSYDMGVAYTSNDLNLKFRWKIYNLQKKEWKTIQEPTKGNWTTWKPEQAGEYWIYVEAIDSAENITSQVMGFYFEGFELSLNGICTVENRSKVDMGVAYKTNDADVQFQWKIYDLTENKWSVISAWNKGNWSSWKPEHTGDYWLYVEVKTCDEQVKSQVMGYHVGNANIKEFDVNPESPGWTDRKVSLKGTYKDLLGEVMLSRFLVYDGEQWTELGRDIESLEWQPSEIGSYLLCYEIDDADGQVLDQSFKGYNVEEPYINMIYVRDEGNLQYSMAISRETNDRDTLYRWMYYDLSNKTWHEINGWSKSTAVSWKAPKEGAFWIYVEAKLHNGVVRDYTMGYTVQDYPTDMRLMMARASGYSSATPYLLMVNRSTHKVGVFQGWQGNWRCIRYWDCSDGTIKTPTVEGTFKIGSRGYYFDSGAARCFWYTQFYGNYLFHSVLYNKNGTLMDGRLGMALSHGCVRLDINNAKWIYDTIPVNSTVCVYH